MNVAEGMRRAGKATSALGGLLTTMGLFALDSGHTAPILVGLVLLAASWVIGGFLAKTPP